MTISGPAICAAILAAVLAAAPAPAHADDYALPDPIMTPGAADVSASVFCAQPSRERRHLARGLSARIANAYSVPPGEIGVLFQLDHLVPLSIGGASTAANLWPQPEDEAAIKDVCDRRIHNLVCAGKVLAADAQRDIAADWPTACARYLGMR